MKTPNLYQVEKRIRGTRRAFPSKMAAIACGVQARFKESTGYSRKVTDTTINVARALGVPEKEIERWASHRLTPLARDAEKLREIRALLEKLYGNSLGITSKSLQ